MAVQFDLIPVIEARSFQAAVIHPESGHTYNMQSRICRRAQPGYIAGIRGDFGFNKRNMKHGQSLQPVQDGGKNRSTRY